MMANKELVVKGIEINFKRINKEDYISLTDLARYSLLFSVWIGGNPKIWSF